MEFRGPFEKYSSDSADLIGAADISGGILDLSSRKEFYLIDTEGDAATDDLDSITGLAVNQVVELSPENNARTIVIKNGTAIKLANGLDFTMNNQYDCIVLRCISAGVCREITRMSGGD